MPIPTQVWTNISMDFIDGLPSSKGKTVLFMVVDRLSKYAHFIPMSHPYIAPKVAQTFFENAFKLHGMPSLIVCDRDSTFISAFWKEISNYRALASISTHLTTPKQMAKLKQ